LRSEHKYYPALDGTRAVAALMVLLFHGAQEGLPLPSVVNFGQTGVDLFFVLSGFLITSILLAARPRDWTEVRTFYARRSLRIFPLYYAALLVCALFFYPVSWPYWIYLQNFWTSMGLTIAGPVHLWSLAVEEQFYLVWPFLVLFVPRRFLVPILWGAILFSFGLRFPLAAHHRDVYSLTLTRLDGLSAGAILAVLHSRGALQRWRTLLGWMAMACGLVIVVAGSLYRNSGAVFFASIKYTLLAAMYAGLIGWLICSPEAWLSRTLAIRPMRFIGRISYGLYVWHPFVLSTIFARMHHRRPWVEACLGYSLVFAVAYASWYGYERQFLRLKERVAREPRLTPREPVKV
jgi:peptidoglycan/LPS O-acetylase OafA/YrhL